MRLSTSKKIELAKDLSYKNHSSLQINVSLGCPVKCSYCPQNLLIKNVGNREKILRKETFIKCLKNIPNNVHIRWTGYSEPCLTPDLTDMITHANELGYNQVISTTLMGNRKSVEFVSRFLNFRILTLHIPDDAGHMQGLKIDSTYLSTLEETLRYQVTNRGINHLNLQCWGKKIHPLVSNLLNRLENQLRVDFSNCYKLYNVLSSRSSSVDRSLENMGFVTSYPKHDSSNLDKNDFYYCSKSSLSNPVMLPTGEVNICCDNYSLSQIKGNLLNSSYDEIQDTWYKDNCQKFISGELLPCHECEHYKVAKTEISPVRLNSASAPFGSSSSSNGENSWSIKVITE